MFDSDAIQGFIIMHYGLVVMLITFAPFTAISLYVLINHYIRIQRIRRIHRYRARIHIAKSYGYLRGFTAGLTYPMERRTK